MTRLADVQSWPALKYPATAIVLGGRLDVGVLEHHDGGLAAELEVDPLDVRGRGRGHRDAGADRAGDRHHRGGGVRHERVARLPVAQDHVEHPGREELERRSRPGAWSRPASCPRASGRPCCPRRGPARPSRRPSSSGSSRAPPGRPRRWARAGVGGVAEPCTPRPPCPPGAGRHRRRTGSGPRRARSPRCGSACSACRCSRSRGPRGRRPGPCTASANFSRACWRSLGVVSRQDSKAVSRRGVGDVDVLPRGQRRPWRIPPPCGVHDIGRPAGRGRDGCTVDEVLEDLVGHGARPFRTSPGSCSSI